MGAGGYRERRSSIAVGEAENVMGASWTERAPCRFAAGTSTRRWRFSVHPRNNGATMDKDRIKGAAEQAKGKVKEQAGKLSGDKKLETEGKVDKTAGKVRNTIGGMKDSLRDQ